MTTIQEQFDKLQAEGKVKIFLEGNKIELEGDVLVVNDCQQLEFVLISDLPKLTKLTIKDCPKLTKMELNLDSPLNISLKEGVKLKTIKTKITNNTSERQITIQSENKKSIDWPCVVGISLGTISLAVQLYRGWRRRKEKCK